VVLQTPYGIVSSPFIAVDRNHKVGKDGKPIPGKVGHDRIQQGAGKQSIGEAIRYWYGLEGERDFETIEVEAAIHADGHFILTPIAVLMRDAKRKKALEKVVSPLSFHRDYESKLWREQIAARRRRSAPEIAWACAQISRIVSEHRDEKASHILESDLLRAGGALSMLGLDLGPYLGRGYDCAESRFQFGNWPSYPAPVEVKKRSRGFSYQVAKYTRLPRAVVLCMEHDFVNPPDHIDFIELPILAERLGRTA
jgi:hypothetical protein